MSTMAAGSISAWHHTSEEGSIMGSRQHNGGSSTSSAEDRSPRLDIGALVISAADGDRDAWELLVTSYSALVSSITEAHGLDQFEAARVRATVWRRLDRNLGKIRQPDRVGAWVGAVARDECVKVLTTSERRAA
jgi:hypothetical protein